MKFNELSEDVKEIVRVRYINYLIATTNFEALAHNSNLYKAYIETKDYYSQVFLGQAIREKCAAQIDRELNNFVYNRYGEVKS